MTTDANKSAWQLRAESLYNALDELLDFCLEQGLEDVPQVITAKLTLLANYPADGYPQPEDDV